VDGLLSRMPAGVMAEWMAFDQVEPVSLGYRAEVSAGIVASLIANVYRDGKKRPKPYEAGEFMPRYGALTPDPSPTGRGGEEPTPAESGGARPEEVWRKVKMWAERYSKGGARPAPTGD